MKVTDDLDNSSFCEMKGTIMGGKEREGSVERAEKFEQF